MNDRYSNFVVAFLYFTLAAFSPLVFANDVRVGVSPTTGYYEVTSKTFDVPKGATVSSSRAVSPVVTPLSGGGFQQSMGGGITIEGLKNPAPFTARAAAGLQTMKNGAKKLARSNPVRFAAGVGLAALLDSVDWLIDDSGKINKSGFDPESLKLNPSSLPSNVYRASGACVPSNGSNCVFLFSGGDGWGGNRDWGCYRALGDNNREKFAGYSRSSGIANPLCYYTMTPSLAANPIEIPVSNTELDDLIDRSYVPVPSDFVLLTPYMPPDFILVDPIPPVQTDLGITNTYDSTGALTGTEQKTSTTEFTVSNNSTSQPSISSSTSVKTETFKDGQSQGSTVTETTQPATGGGSKVEIPTVEIPTDCDFHPTLCKWLDWTKEEPEEPDDNLSNLLKEVPISSKTFTISGGAAACPAPLVLNLSQFGSREVSYQPLCDLASTMKYLYLALMSFAAAVLLNRSINRV